jgi:hypothetical protein
LVVHCDWYRLIVCLFVGIGCRLFVGIVGRPLLVRLPDVVNLLGGRSVLARCGFIAIDCWSFGNIGRLLSGQRLFAHWHRLLVAHCDWFRLIVCLFVGCLLVRLPDEVNLLGGRLSVVACSSVLVQLLVVAVCAFGWNDTSSSGMTLVVLENISTFPARYIGAWVFWDLCRNKLLDKKLVFLTLITPWKIVRL